MIDGFTIALLTSEFGQVWAEQGLRQLHTTSGEILGLHNYAVADKGSIDDGQCRDWKNCVQL